MKVFKQKKTRNVSQDFSVRGKNDKKKNNAAVVNYHAVFNALEDALVLYDPFEQKIIETNKSAFELFGYSNEGLLGLPVEAFELNDKERPLQKAIEKVKFKGEGTTTPFQSKYKNPEGEEFLCEVTVKPFEVGPHKQILIAIRKININIRQEAIKEKGTDTSIDSSEPQMGAQRHNLTETYGKKVKSIIEYPDYSDKTILIVEDDEANRKYLISLVKRTKARVLEAENGFEAIEQVDGNNAIDLILMDIKMPDMNGIEATQRIKEKHGHIKIIAQTAYAMLGDKQKAIDAGCDDYMTKPIDKQLFLTTLKKILVGD